MDEVDEAMAEEGLEWSEGQVQAFAMTGQFGEIAYYLGNNPEEAVRLAKINHPANFDRALGKIEAKIESAAEALPDDPKEKEKEVDDPASGKDPLKKPVGEVVKGGGSGGAKDAEWWANNASPEEYTAARKKRQRIGTG